MVRGLIYWKYKTENARQISKEGWLTSRLNFFYFKTFLKFYFLEQMFGRFCRLAIHTFPLLMWMIQRQLREKIAVIPNTSNFKSIQVWFI